jgi:hypothetical protein
MKLIYSLLSKLLGRNLKSTPKEVILDQLNEPRPLPMGRTDFDEWSHRIISGALVPGGEEDAEVFIDSQRYALANMLIHLGPTESHKPDAHFIHSLRKFAINQVAHSIAQELKIKCNERLDAREKAKNDQQAS